MGEELRMCERGILEPGGLTSLEGSGGGNTPSPLPSGLPTGKCGLGVVLVSPSPQRDGGQEPPTQDTSGLSGSASSRSATLQSSLGNRLRASLPLAGLTLFKMTWKERVTPSGRRICALRASGHRTLDRGSGSWPTPNAIPEGRGGLQSNPEKAMERRAQGHQLNLDDAATLAGWPTPNTPSGGRSMSIEKMDATGRTVDGKKHTASLEHAVKFAHWATPSANEMRTTDPEQLERRRQECKERTGNGNGFGLTLGNQMTLLVDSGVGANGSPAATEKPGQLNPAFSLWLQGYPAAWLSCGAQAIASCRKSRRSSSKRISTAARPDEAP